MTAGRWIVLGSLAFDVLLIVLEWWLFVPLLIASVACAVSIAGWVVTWDERYGAKVWPRRLGPRDR